jgi:hypothetical protein
MQGEYEREFIKMKEQMGHQMQSMQGSMDKNSKLNQDLQT